MVTYTTEKARIEADLAIVEASIQKILQNGQGFRKGGASGFLVDFAKLPVLRQERDMLRAKLATWEATQYGIL